MIIERGSKMAKMQRLEILIGGFMQESDGVQGCAVVSRLGQGDMLYEANLGGIDPAFLSTVVSSILLIGEKLGHELKGRDLGYTLIDYGCSAALIIPCSEEVALLVAVKGPTPQEKIIGAAGELARKIGGLLGNKMV